MDPSKPIGLDLLRWQDGWISPRRSDSFRSSQSQKHSLKLTALAHVRSGSFASKPSYCACPESYLFGNFSAGLN